jgi:hypothetical protein
MRLVLTPRVRRRAVGWLWPVALLAVPGCILPEYHAAPPVNLNPGPDPTGVVFCDIELSSTRHCPMSQAEIDAGIPLNEAALALTSGRSSGHGLDYSPDALALCDGQPQIVPFQGSFPQGFPVCLDCGAQIPSHYADAAAVCLAQCEDLTAPNVVPPDPSVVASCGARTRVSTNAADPTSCFGNGCSDGVFNIDFDDPRRISEPVTWQDLIGVAAGGADGNDLTRTSATPIDPQVFDAGADGAQVITHGDAYVQFTADAIDQARLCGLSHGEPPDNDPDYHTIDFALDLFKDGRFYVYETGTRIMGGDLNDSFGTYNINETFRVHVKDNLDGTGPFKPMGGTATISYARVLGACADGSPCNEDVFYQSKTVTVSYPFRVDTSFHDQSGSLVNVRVVRMR